MMVSLMRGTLEANVFVSMISGLDMLGRFFRKRKKRRYSCKKGSLTNGARKIFMKRLKFTCFYVQHGRRVLLAIKLINHYQPGDSACRGVKYCSSHSCKSDSKKFHFFEMLHFFEMEAAPRRFFRSLQNDWPRHFSKKKTDPVSPGTILPPLRKLCYVSAPS